MTTVMIKTAELYKILKDVEKGKMSADSAEAQILFQFTQQHAAHTVTAWVEIPVSERMPENKRDKHFVLYGNSSIGTLHVSGFSKWQTTHWLEQVQLPIQGYSLEEVEAIWAAGVKYGEGVEDNLLPFYDVIKSLTNEQPTTDTD